MTEFMAGHPQSSAVQIIIFFIYDLATSTE